MLTSSYCHAILDADITYEVGTEVIVTREVDIKITLKTGPMHLNLLFHPSVCCSY